MIACRILIRCLLVSVILLFNLWSRSLIFGTSLVRQIKYSSKTFIKQRYLIVRDFLFLRPQSFRVLRLPRFGSLLLNGFRFGGVHAPLKGTPIRDTRRWSIISRCSAAISHGYRQGEPQRVVDPYVASYQRFVADTSSNYARRLGTFVITTVTLDGRLYYADSAELRNRLLATWLFSRNMLSTRENVISDDDAEDARRRCSKQRRSNRKS